MLARPIYFLRRALLHIQRRPALTLVTVATVAVVFFVLGMFAVIGHNLARVAVHVGEGLQLEVFLRDDCSPAAQEAIRAVLATSPHVERLDFISRAAALARFQQRLGAGSAAALDDLGDDLLPASFVATLAPASRQSAVLKVLADDLLGQDGVEEVQYGQQWLTEFGRFLGSARLLGLVIGALIVLAALVIVSNTIRLSVYARQGEVEILKLVGATDAFVKIPFYLEGSLLGLAGAALGVLLTWAVFTFAVPRELLPAGLLGVEGLEFLPGLAAAWMIAGGAVLGILGTVFSLGRHLRV